MSHLSSTTDHEAIPVPHGGWERVFAQSPIAMGIAVDFTYVHANQAYCDLVGRSLADIIGTDARTFFPSDMDDQIASAAAQVASGEPRIHLDGPFIRGDGATRWASIDAVLITSDDGRVTTVVQAVDTTDLHHARLDEASSERRFRKLLSNTQDVVILTDAEGEPVYSTVGRTTAMGFTAGYWQDIPPRALVHPDDIPKAAEAWREALANPGQTISSELRMQNASGQWIDVAVTSVNLLDDADVAGVILTARNITELRAAEQLASSQADVLELIARGAPLSEILEQCVVLVETNGIGGRSSIYLLEGEHLEMRAGRAPEAINDWMREPPRSAERSLCDQAIITGEPALLPDLATAPPLAGLRDLGLQLGIRASWSQPVHAAGSGEVIGTLSTIYDEPHEPLDHERKVAEVACTLVSIALERVANEDRLAHQALHDALTGLPNRSLLVDRLEHALARRERTDAHIAVLFCDLDRFKVVNDSLGHGVGDQLLVAFAERLIEAVDPGDTVARFGGDEFVVLLEDVEDSARPLAVAAEIQRSLEQPFATGKGQEVFLTASIGLAAASDHTSSDGWLRDADAAMYRAKDLGRNRLELFDTAMREAAVIRLQIENDLRRAVERNELIVHYQPIVELRSGRVVGAEALVRWQHPVRGLLPPDDFITIAEETGTIEALGQHVLETAVREMAAIADRIGVRGLRLGVNLSARQLSGARLDEVVDAACKEHSWPHRDLLLEITETALVEGTSGPHDVLARIRALGVDLAIDDFGTGHSSLTRLGNMPVNQVKIDRTFVGAIDQDDERLVRIVDAVVAVAGALDLTTSAEGVESQAQLDYLRRIRCDLAQGFFFAKPLPADEFESLLAADPRW